MQFYFPVSDAKWTTPAQYAVEQSNAVKARYAAMVERGDLPRRPRRPVVAMYRRERTDTQPTKRRF